MFRVSFAHSMGDIYLFKGDIDYYGAVGTGRITQVENLHLECSSDRRKIRRHPRVVNCRFAAALRRH